VGGVCHCNFNYTLESTYDAEAKTYQYSVWDYLNLDIHTLENLYDFNCSELMTLSFLSGQ